MERKIPPPVLFFACALLIYALPRSADTNRIYLLFAVLLAIFGAAVALSALFAFRQKRTTLSPRDLESTAALVTHGIYRFSRNPMYLGLACWLAAWALWFNAFFGLLVVWGFIAYLNRFQIQPEERILAAKFGETYREYQRNTPRWLW